MSGLMTGLKKFFTKDRVMIIVIFVLLAAFLMYYSRGKVTTVDTMTSPLDLLSKGEEKDEKKEELQKVENFTDGVLGSSYNEKITGSATDLLPQDTNSEWSALNPTSQGNPISTNLLEVGIHQGAISQTLRNANQQLRSDPVIQKGDTGPWNQSTIEADVSRVPLEVGSTCPQ